MRKLIPVVLIVLLLCSCKAEPALHESDYIGDVEYTEAEYIYNKYQDWKAIYTRIQMPATCYLPDGSLYMEYVSYVEYSLEPDGTLSAVINTPDNVYVSASPNYIPDWEVPVIDFVNYECRLEEGIYFCYTAEGDEVRMREDSGTLHLFYNGRQWRLTV